MIKHDHKKLLGMTFLVVDDENDIRDILADSFELYGAKTLRASNGKIALGLLKNNKIDLIISDVKMPGGDGIELLKAVNGLKPPQPPVLLLSGFSDIVFENAKKLGAFDILEKPFRISKIIEIICNRLL